MFESAERSPARTTPNAPPNVGDLLEDVLYQGKTLVQAEFSLAKRELTGELKAAVGALGLIAGGVMFLQAGLVTLGVTLVMTFGIGWAAVAVVIALFASGAVLVLLAIRSLEQRKLPRTTERLALDAKQVMETVK